MPAESSRKAVAGRARLRQMRGQRSGWSMEPRLIVLDVSAQAKVIQLLLRLREQPGLASLFISHDPSLTRNVADETAILYL